MSIVPSKGGFKVVSKSGKNLGFSPTKKGAVKRLGEVEFFKKKAQRKALKS